MPIIASFFGIYIRMFFDDHAPPHFHVEYQGHEANVAIATGEIIKGKLPRRAHAIVKQWCSDHRAELEENWANGQALLPLNRIAGADND